MINKGKLVDYDSTSCRVHVIHEIGHLLMISSKKGKLRRMHVCVTSIGVHVETNITL
jgi:hypothetical protein